MSSVERRGLSLDLVDLVQSFPDAPRPVLTIKSFRLDAGDRIAVQGASGTGKTSLLNILAGLARPKTGSVSWGGRIITQLSEGRRDAWRAAHMGMVFQDFHLIDGMTPLENIMTTARFSSFQIPDDVQARARDLMKRVGLDPMLRSIDTLSRGERQRIAVARALLSRPGVILADEPTASLDPETGAAITDLLFALAGETGATMIVVTHDADVAGRADRVYRLTDGMLNAEAT